MENCENYLIRFLHVSRNELGIIRVLFTDLYKESLLEIHIKKHSMSSHMRSGEGFV